jgi:hypothetical protein
MSERCPLPEGRFVWSEKIPEECRSQCDELRMRANIDVVPDIDPFTSACDEESDTECTHDVVYKDESLENVGHRKRAVTILNMCAETTTELYSETYTFDCPYDS